MDGHPHDASPVLLQTLVQALAPHDLIVRGGFAPGPDDGVPALPAGAGSRSLWLVGVAGSAFWPRFKASPQFADGQPDPLDRWSREIGNALAQRMGGVALFPFDGPPYRPFQRWAQRAEALRTSPLGLSIHPVYGLWQAYRFALHLPVGEPVRPARPAPMAPTNLCATCTDQPCLSACPVAAFTGSAYRLDACAAHLHAPQGQACRQDGCLARRACPVGVAYRYEPEHAAFHTAAFMARHG